MRDENRLPSGTARVVLCILALAAGRAARGETFEVTTLADAGPGSLRDAVERANAAPGADLITFQAGLAGTISLASGQLEVSDDLEIHGPGDRVLALSGAGTHRVIFLARTASQVRILGLTIERGGADHGAGIRSAAAALTLEHVRIRNCSATGKGGGLFLESGAGAKIRHSFLSDDWADDGGGVAADAGPGELHIEHSWLVRNLAFDEGGGLWTGRHRPVAITHSTIAANNAIQIGGGMFLSPAGPITVRDSTVSGNISTRWNGGIYTPGGVVVLENTTIVGNESPYGYAVEVAIADPGTRFDFLTVTGNRCRGGLLIQGGVPPLRNSIVAGNQGLDLLAISPYYGQLAVSYSLVGSFGTNSVQDHGGNRFGVDPELGPLADNGGPTATCLPAATSPALDAADPADLPHEGVDQRGRPRVANGRPDMGAVERQSAPANP